MSARLLQLVIALVAVLVAAGALEADAQEVEGGPYLGAGLSLGEPTTNRLGDVASLGVGGSLRGGYWLISQLGIEARFRLLDVNADVGGRYIFDMSAGPRLSLRFGPVRLQPAVHVGYAVFNERCVEVELAGTFCHGPRQWFLDISALLGFRWQNHTFGVSAAYGGMPDGHQAWTTFALDWSMSFGR